MQGSSDGIIARSISTRRHWRSRRESLRKRQNRRYQRGFKNIHTFFYKNSSSLQIFTMTKIIAEFTRKFRWHYSANMLVSLSMESMDAYNGWSLFFMLQITSINSKRGGRFENQNYFSMYRLQAKKLQYNQRKEKSSWQNGN